MGSLFQLEAKSIKFIKTIALQKSTHNKTVASFLLGDKKKGQAFNPVSICRINSHHICITDAMNGIVAIIDNNGMWVKKIKRIKGFKLISPVSACTDDDGNLYVSDSAAQVILQWDSHYKFEKIFIQMPDTRMTGILFSRGKFFALDTRNHRILCFDIHGTLLFSFGTRGSGDLKFNYPTHIAADENYLYITDAMNFRVQIVTQQGKFVRSFGALGRGGGNFSKPKGVAVDSQQNIYVADAMFDNIQIFNTKGEFLYYFGGPGHQNGQFWMPGGIMTDSDNTIWVADTYNQRLQIFKLQEDTP